jgi:predicted secreted hydrolase
VLTRNLLSFFCCFILVGSVHSQEFDYGSWREATPSYVMEFPRDHASHPDYRIEWWYYTGNLESIDGRRFGYQLTFFRVGINSQPTNPSRWAVRDLHMAHLAVTDIRSGRHLVSERLSRSGVGWAGARSDTLSVWNEGWTIQLDGTAHVLNATDDLGRIGLKLNLEPERVPLLHGESGFSQKGSREGNSSHYYSLTRMKTSGQLILENVPIEVNGLSWMDHEFGTSFLESDQLGWDWFSLQFDDGTDLMLYALRRQDESRDRNSGGTVLVDDGVQIRLMSNDYRLVPGRTWTSPSSGAQYPVEWQIEIPSLDLELVVRATVDSQELHTNRSTGVTYWEGAVDAVGVRLDQAIVGRGYLEMTGYAGPPMSEVLR